MMASKDKTSDGTRWGFDKRVGPATIVNLVQLITIVWWAATFHTQVTDNQARNEDRFTQFSEERKTQSESMLKLQEAENQLLLQLTKLSDQQEITTENLKELRDVIQNKKGN